MYVNGKTLVRTRFAPSPTGSMHLGGARTALFNYLFAQHYGGSFVLRIDDTDQNRNIKTAIKPILDGLEWLGITFDEGPVYQHERNKHYLDRAEELIVAGVAYPDDGVMEQNCVYRGHNRNLYKSHALALWYEKTCCLRYRVSPGHPIIVDDLIRGPIEFNTSHIGDPVIVRSDRTATYNFATAIDDGEMKITHVIRGEEHVNNTPIQMMLMQDMNLNIPLYAHLPCVCEPDNTQKLSKRNVTKFLNIETIKKLQKLGFSRLEIVQREELNPVTLSYYQALGYKPEGVLNYLARLGWSVDGNRELMTKQFMIENFSLDRVVKASAHFEPQKLLWYSEKHLENDTLENKTTNCIEFLAQAGIIQKPIDKEMTDFVRKIVELLGPRIKVYSDIVQMGACFFAPQPFVEEDVKKYLNEDTRTLMDGVIYVLKQIKVWSAKNVDSGIREFMALRGLTPNSLIFGIRVALCGCNVGPGIGQTMELIGQEECIKRIETALKLPV